MAAAASQRTLSLWQAASIQPWRRWPPVSARATQHRREPFVVSAFLAYKAREWHTCAMAGQSRRSSPHTFTQVDPPVSQTGLPLIVVPQGNSKPDLRVPVGCRWSRRVPHRRRSSRMYGISRLRGVSAGCGLCQRVSHVQGTRMARNRVIESTSNSRCLTTI